MKEKLHYVVDFEYNMCKVADTGEERTFNQWQKVKQQKEWKILNERKKLREVLKSISDSWRD